MPRSNGVYNLPAIYAATPGTTIRSEQHNTPLEDIAQALTGSLPRDGSAPMQGNLPMGGRKITGLGAPTAAGDAATKQYADSLTPTETSIDMTGPGFIGKGTAGNGKSLRITFGDGLRLLSGALTVNLGAGLSIVSGAIAAAVSRIATQAEAEAGTENTAAMTALRVNQHMNANAYGWGQSWENLTSTRESAQVYRNTTARPIMVSICGDPSALSSFQVSSNGTSGWVTISALGDVSGDGRSTMCVTVPNGIYYRLNGSVNLFCWAELR